MPIANLTSIAKADGSRPSLKLSRQEALWVVPELGPEELPLFTAAQGTSERQKDDVVANADGEAREPTVALRPMAVGREVVEDYGHTGLSLRWHPVSFLPETLSQRRIIPCAEAMGSRDRRWCVTAGVVLIGQRPGSAKGVMVITLEDETGVANLVV